MNKFLKSFTLIELLIVIVIIGILAVALIPRLTGAQGMARDKARIADMKQIQTALEFYASEHGGKYPSTRSWGVWMWNWWWLGNCSVFSGYWISGPSGYIPNLAPDYISSLPLDPKPNANSCYIYKSNGIDYMFLVYKTVEWNIPSEFLRPSYSTGEVFAIYTSWARAF